MSSILERSARDPLFGWTATAFKEELRLRLTGRAQSAYLFGSFDTEQFGPNSDVDLIVVTDTQQPFMERQRAFWDLLDLGPTIDLLVYTPEEFAQLTCDPSPGFWRSVVATMQRVL